MKEEVLEANLDLRKKDLVISTWGNVSEYNEVMKKAQVRIDQKLADKHYERKCGAGAYYGQN